MDNASHAALEFDKVRETLAERALTESAKRAARALSPIANDVLCARAVQETGDARALIEANGLPPLALTEGVAEMAALAAGGAMLEPEQLTFAATFGHTCGRMASYMKKGEAIRVELSLNGRAFLPLEELEREIDGAIRVDRVDDAASSLLRDVRRKIERQGDALRQKLAAMLRAHPDWYADAYATVRGGRQTLPVRAQYRSMVHGAVIDRSQTGGTLFIEPDSVREAQSEIEALKIDEENEVRRILYALSGAVGEAREAIEANATLMERLDLAFAKGKLSLDMDALAVAPTKDGGLRIVKGRHPLLSREIAVPLNFALEEPLRGLVVTGPNTGGKTVALKTVGLLSLMAQSGLHVPAAEGTRLRMFDRVLCDVGDGQSISENLSTFSAHMTRVLSILREATRDSLVLLDELGSGTDPAEGMGLAVAVLDELSARGCLFAATTHYPEIKEYARQSPCVQNARMRFDPATLAPLYEMEAGEAGESCALHIARRLGFPETLLKRAERAAYAGEIYAGAARPAMRAEGASSLSTIEAPKTPPERALKFGRGDSVRVYPEGQVGIVCAQSDERGNLLVQTRAGKRLVAHKRLKLLVKASELYPEDYDFSIVFDTVENRKARHVMERKFDPDAVIRE